MLQAKDLIKILNLEPHVEGGYFKRVYTSSHKIKERYIASAIYYLLEENDISAFHRLQSDELWCFNYGSSLTLHLLDNNGNLQKIILGESDQAIFQVTIHANQWFAAEVNDKKSFSLISCFVSPAFEYQYFELGKREELITLFPQHEKLIKKFTK